jgi:hypothetical protein
MRRLGLAIAVLVFGLVSVGAALAATGIGRHGEIAPSDLPLTAEPTSKGAGAGDPTPAPNDEDRLRAIRAVPSGQATPASREGAVEGAGVKEQQPITGAVVHDPDDCGDVCTDADPDADDAGDGSPAPGDGGAGPTTGVDDDGDGDYDDCGDTAEGSGGGSAGVDDAGDGGGSAGADDDGDGDGGDCGESGD